MAGFMKESSKEIKNKGLEFLSGRMEASMKDIEKMIK